MPDTVTTGRQSAGLHSGAQTDPSLFNADLAPVPPEKRTWKVYDYASLWVAMSVCIPTYMLASGLIAGGMNWWQAVGTILLGNLIVLMPMLLNAHAGTKYGIPFPVLVRSSFGVRGANLPANAIKPCPASNPHLTKAMWVRTSVCTVEQSSTPGGHQWN